MRGIYGIFGPCGRAYIGQASDIKNRWSAHKGQLRRGKHVTPRLQNAWNKHGEAAFSFRVLLEFGASASSHELAQAEERLIAHHETTCGIYNSTRKVWPTYERTAETNAKSSLAAKRRYADEREREKTSVALRGRPKTAEARAKFSAAKVHRHLGEFKPMSNIYLGRKCKNRYEVRVMRNGVLHRSPLMCLAAALAHRDVLLARLNCNV